MIPKHHLEIGVRIRVGQHYGTIRYIGEVANTEGEWIGVEWDDPQRGKHSGMVNGVEYFQTRNENAGSMIRSEKIPTFCTLLEAIHDKYIVTEDNLRFDAEMLKEVQKQLHASLFEIVGMEKIGGKQSNLHHLTDVSVAFSTVNSAGNLSYFTSLRSLDVSATLIWNWEIVGDIMSQIPTLEEVNLSSNRLMSPTDEEISYLVTKFHNLKKLILKNCALSSWADIVRLARMWPSLENLSLENNELGMITEENYEFALTQLRSLDLQDNNISDETSIYALGSLPGLMELSLNANGIQRIVFPDCPHTEKAARFSGLRTLYLRENPIFDQCAAFNELDKLGALEHLTIDPDPNVSYEETVARVVGSIAGLKMFNRSRISEKLRRDSECDMWKMYAVQWAQIRGDAQQLKAFFKSHRMYPRVMDKLGSPEQILPDNRKVSNMLNLHLLNERTGEMRQKKVPKQINLQTLENLIVKLFGPQDQQPNKGGSLQLSLFDRKRDVRIPLDNHGKSLDFYSVEDQDTIVF
ncbi:tubulin-specific chaperone E [Toxorhynchites rutilus septentrionalis]|uniref:tubulin-specific chaperone E n=1 Tax=Toxorhynchites rutilus septentrionalis TaxID=329112 RepID=UPI0024798B5A|nr:tubulin-specific chaperone E [Toxorhynchites rutilus septentrionalis]